MSKVLVTESSLEDIADAIREKLGVQTLYKPGQMATAIESISGITQADEGKVVSNGALVAQTSTTVTENGTVDTTLNNEVVVNVPGGGGGGGAAPTFLTHSTQADVIENLYYDTFDSSDGWGSLDVAGTPTRKLDGVAVSSGSGFSVSLGEDNHSVTVYAIVRANTSSGDYMPVSVAKATSSGQCPSFYTRGGAWYTSVWSNDTGTAVASDKLTVLTLAVDGSGKNAYYYVNGASKGSKEFTNSGSTVRFNGSTSHSNNANSFSYIYVGAVDGCEDSTTIIANQQDMLDFLEDALILEEGSGGSGIPTISRSDWNALTTAQKQAYGLVGVIDSNSGFARGDVYNGADYPEVNEYLPSSDSSKATCFARCVDYVETKSTWGIGSKPITFASGPTPLKDSDGAVYIKTKTDSTLAYVDLGATMTPFTAYIVAKLNSPGTYSRIMSCMAARSSGQGMLLFGSTINVASWASDTSTGVRSSSWFVGALQYGGGNSGKGSAIGSASATPSFISKLPSNCGRYIAIGSTDNSLSGSNVEPSDVAVKFFAVIEDVEAESDISANMSNLASMYLS